MPLPWWHLFSPDTFSPRVGSPLTKIQFCIESFSVWWRHQPGSRIMGTWRSIAILNFFGENTNKCGITITLENYEKQNSIHLPLCGFYSLIYSGIFGRFRSKASQHFNPNIWNFCHESYTLWFFSFAIFWIQIHFWPGQKVVGLI